MQDFAALAYLEYRQTAHRVREAARSPARVLMYLFLVAYFVFLFSVRSRTAMHSRLPSNGIAEPYASAVLFAYIAIIGVAAYGAASGFAGAFSSAADGRFLIGSRLGERKVLLWLQLRRSAGLVLRMLFTILMYAAIFAGHRNPAGIGIAMLGGTIALAAIGIPMLKVRAAAGAHSAHAIAGAVFIAGVIPLAITLSTFLDTRFAGWSRLGERIGAGSAFNALFAGNAVALGALYAFAAALLAIAVFAASDLYPEIYSSSLRILDIRHQRRKRERSYRNSAIAQSRSPFTNMSGPWTIAWKEWIAFTRSPGAQRVFFFGFFTCAAGGVILGRVAHGSRDGIITSVAFGGSIANMFVIFYALGSSTKLAEDLHKPLWWMGPDTLWVRLCTWIAGTSWPLALCVAVALVAWGATLRTPTLALAGVPAAVAVVLYLRAIGLALYALFPSALDQRGPLAMVRVLLTYVFAAPPFFAAVVIGVLAHSAAAGLAVGIASSLIEAVALVAFAARRIAGRGIAFAQAETA